MIVEFIAQSAHIAVADPERQRVGKEPLDRSIGLWENKFVVPKWRSSEMSSADKPNENVIKIAYLPVLRRRDEAG